MTSEATDAGGLTGAESLQVGRTLWAVTRPPITRTHIVRYAGASGDFTRIHHDDPYAQAAGNPSVFAMGLYPAGILASLVADQFGVSAMRGFGVRFLAKVWPGDELTYSARVDAIDTAIHLGLAVSDRFGILKLTGWSDVRAPSALDDGSCQLPQRPQRGPKP